MNDNIYKTPSSEIISEQQITASPTRPWAIYFICFWFFIGIGNTLDKILSGAYDFIFSNENYSLIAGIVTTYGILIVVIVGMVRLRRTYLIIGGVSFILVALVSLLSISSLSEAGMEPAIFVTIIGLVVVLSSICAWYCLRPSFLNMADNFVAHKKSQNL